MTTPKRPKTPKPPAPPVEPERLSFVPDAADGSARLSATRRWTALAALILGSSLAFIDGTVVNVALPAIQGALAASPAQAQWIVNGYLLALGALVLLGGAAGDRWGRKRVFLIGVVFFTLASLLCSAVWTIENLVAGRVLQGVGAALLVPTALALVPACFDEHERGRALGVWAGASAAAAAVGPVIGGWITDEYSWRGVFLINGPIAALCLALALWALPEARRREADPPDWAGAALAVTALGLVGWGLSAALEWGLMSLRTWGVLLAAAAAAWLFWRVERRSPYPMLPVSLFRDRAFAGVNLLTLFLYFALAGVLYLLPYEWMRVDGRGAAQVGAGLLPFSVILGLASPLAGRLADRHGRRPFLIGGPALAGAGMLLMLLPGVDADYWTAWFPALVLLALGMAATIPALTAALFEAVEPERTGVASGINNAAARVGGLLAAALLTLVLGLVFAAHLGGDPEAAAERLTVVMGGGGYSDSVSAVEREAFRRGFQAAMALCAALAFAAAAVAAVAAPRRPPYSEA